ncbi:MAG: alr [Parachlamydiales bacterium]|nr:alr [Parachlamydiales bacterium]
MKGPISQEGVFSTPTGPAAAATSVPRSTASEIPHPSWIEIDLQRFRDNLAVIRRQIGQSRLCCVVKANAYGHGLVPMAQAASVAGVDYFGVAHLSEAVCLRRAGIVKPILVLGAIHEDQIDDLIRFDLEFTVSSAYKAQLVAEAAQRHAVRCRVHLEIDTGMRRTGVRVESALALIDDLLKWSCFDLRGIYSHFAMSETPNDPTTLRQIEQFLALKEKVGPTAQSIIWHLANSGGIAYYPDSHLDMVRVGLLCYGLSLPHSMSALKLVLSLKSKISYFKVVAANEGISYGHTYRTRAQTRVVTVPVGYGDGYRRDFSNKMSVLIRGQRHRIAGSVCMDQFMVDIGDKEAYVGDEVVLIGRQGNEEIQLSEMVDLIKTDPREILCHFNDRIPRIYTAHG